MGVLLAALTLTAALLGKSVHTWVPRLPTPLFPDIQFPRELDEMLAPWMWLLVEAVAGKHHVHLQHRVAQLLYPFFHRATWIPDQSSVNRTLWICRQFVEDGHAKARILRTRTQAKTTAGLHKHESRASNVPGSHTPSRHSGFFSQYRSRSLPRKNSFLSSSITALRHSTLPRRRAMSQKSLIDFSLSSCAVLSCEQAVL